jgi:transposase
MAKTRPPYSPEFRRQIVELVHSGRDPDDLAREFEPTAQSIRHWVAVADRRDGRRAEKKPDVVTPTEHDELLRLRRENKQLRQERDILSRAAAWFARETGAVPSGSSNS